MASRPIAGGSAARRALMGSFLALADHSDIRRVERVIAVARVVVALGALIMLAWVPVDVVAGTDPTALLLVAYSIAGIVLLVMKGRHQNAPRRLPVVAQILDIACAVFMASYGRLGGPLLLLLLFPLLAAGYRRGFRAVMGTVAILDGLLLVQHWLFSLPLGVPLTAAADALRTNALVTNTIFVAIGGAVVGYLSENERWRRSEAAAVSRVVSQGRPGAEFNETLHQVLISIQEVFSAARVLLVLQDTRAQRVLCWSASTSTTEESLIPSEVPSATRPDYLFPTPGAAWHAAAPWFGRSRQFNVIAIDKLGRRLPSASLALPDGFVAAHPCRRVIGVGVTFGDEWTGRLFILEPALGIHRDVGARLALRLVTHAGHVMYGVYLLHRVRRRAQGIERGRIARELHDGLTQSLLGLEMQLAAVRRRAIEEAPELGQDLSRMHAVLREEIIKLRELMEGVRAGTNTSGDILEELADIVERFRRYTGIAATFESEHPAVDVSVQTRRQIARILHEALMNVRKHSNAKRVMVRVAADDRCWRLSVQDDGRGFRFAGRYSHDELDEMKQGPRLIAERVRMIGATLVVESRPGSGASVEITMPVPVRHD